MVRARLAQSLYALLFLCFSAAFARGQGVRAFIMAGGSFRQDNRFFTNLANRRFESSYASGGRITIGGELSLANIIGVEGSYGYGRNNLRIRDLAQSQTLGYGMRTQRLSVNLMGHSPVAVLGLRPYATGGLEYDHLGPTDQANRLAFTRGFAGQQLTLGNSNQVGVNYGGGVEWSFFPTLALRLDLRDHITGTPTYGLSSARYRVSGAAHNVEFSLGVVFHIGK